eukprot:gene7283-11218_t
MGDEEPKKDAPPADAQSDLDALGESLWETPAEEKPADAPAEEAPGNGHECVQ